MTSCVTWICYLIFNAHISILETDKQLKILFELAVNTYTCIRGILEALKLNGHQVYVKD